MSISRVSRPFLALTILVLILTASIFAARGPMRGTLTQLDHFFVDLGASYQPVVKLYAHHVIKGPRIEQI